jgi:hypothetical protein
LGSEANEFLGCGGTIIDLPQTCVPIRAMTGIVG